MALAAAGVVTAAVLLNSPETAEAVPISGSMPCPGGGHVTWSGNRTAHADGTASGTIKYNFSSPTNNLDDCDLGNGIILSGTVNKTFSGLSTFPTWNADGTVGQYRRGESGGLTLVKDCRVFVSSFSGSAPTGENCGITWPIPAGGGDDDDDDDFQITTVSIPTGDTTSGLPYFESVDAVGGHAPCTWDATGLPAGFSLVNIVDTGSGNVICDAVMISGGPFNHPELIGSYPITVNGHDSDGHDATKDFTLVIVQ